ncbi:copper-binding protein [Cyclospora cayetanensis]|uniref:Copper-binding protein n=1 Tax=Cyclospora cayetanensis TaxID=88456 RepID=A0A1D3CVY3_9EIME|nr:copper-binding protein [Cyclospora cayetanensis]
MTHFVVLRVEGITCGGCVDTIEKALGQREGVYSARVALDEHKVSVYCAPEVTEESLIASLEELGFTASSLREGETEASDSTQKILNAFSIDKVDLRRRTSSSHGPPDAPQRCDALTHEHPQMRLKVATFQIQGQ